MRRLLGALWFVSIAAVVCLAVATNVGPRVGLQVFAIRGGSMAPTIPLGAAVIAGHTATDDIEVGDIVTIRADNGVVYTHRVVDIDASESVHWLRTKGDANTTADAAPVPATSVLGVVDVWVPLVGFLIGMLATPVGVVSFLAFAVALLGLIWELEEAEDATATIRRPIRSPDVARA
jgi:signal peptidase I